MKKVLIITYYWPPAGGPGVQRVLKFVKYLPRFGWKPTVLTVESGEYQAVDFSMISEIPSDLEVRKTKSLDLYRVFKNFTGQKTIPTHQLSQNSNDSIFIRISRWIRLNLVLPDGRIGWLPFAVRGGNKILLKEKFDLIFSSGPPHSVHLIAKKLAIKFKLPWVADFRDPWTERFYYVENKRSRLSNNIELKMEISVLKTATAVTAASNGFRELLLSKIGTRDKGNVITNGFDPNDFSNISASKSHNAITITHIGNLAKSQLPLPLLLALQTLHSGNEIRKYHLKLIGSVHPEIRRTVERFKLNNIVEFEDYIEHGEAIREMQQADYVFAVVPETENNSGIIPGKIFEYMKSGTPIILIGPHDCDAAEIVRLTKSGHVFGYKSEAELSEWISERRTINPQNLVEFSRRAKTEKLSEVFGTLF